MRRKLGTAGLGFLATRAEEASASCAGDIFLISATEKDLESMIALELQKWDCDREQTEHNGHHTLRNLERD